jgi:hypothetical protein
MKTSFARLGASAAGGLLLLVGGCLSVQPSNPDPLPPPQPPRTLTADERARLAAREADLTAQLDRERQETGRLRARLAELERIKKDR